MDPGTLKPVLPQRSSSQRALGFCPGGLRLNCKGTLICLQIQMESLLTHTGKQKHAAREYHGATIAKMTCAGSQFSMEAKITFSSGFLVQLLTH